MNKKFKINDAGFTLVELLVVIGIIAILSGILIINNQSAINTANDTKVKAFVASIPITLSGNYVANWKFDQVLGSAAPYTTPDSYGANTATLGDGTCAAGAGTCPTQLSGTSCVFGSCFSFDGGDYLRIISVATPVNFNFSSTGSFSVGAWIKTSTNGRMIISDSWILSGANPAWIFYTDSATGYLKFYGSAGTAGWAIGTKAITDDKWHYAFMSYKNKTVTFYIDGVADTPVTIAALGSGTMSTATYGAVIGASFNNSNTTFSNYYSGSMDDVSVYGDALQIGQIRRQYLAGLKKLLAKGQISETEYVSRLDAPNQCVASK